MNSDVVLLGFAYITHHDYRQPVSWTNQRQHHQDGYATPSTSNALLAVVALRGPCLAVLESCTPPWWHTQLSRRQSLRGLSGSSSSCSSPQQRCFEPHHKRTHVTASLTHHECIQTYILYVILAQAYIHTYIHILLINTNSDCVSVFIPWMGQACGLASRSSLLALPLRDQYEV